MSLSYSSESNSYAPSSEHTSSYDTQPEDTFADPTSDARDSMASEIIDAQGRYRTRGGGTIPGIETDGSEETLDADESDLAGILRGADTISFHSSDSVVDSLDGFELEEVVSEDDSLVFTAMKRIDRSLELPKNVSTQTERT